MDTETVDRQFNALQQQAQQTETLIQTLAGKLSTATAAGDPNAREWALDLKEIALAIRDEQSTTSELLQAIHALVDNHVAAEPSAPPYYPPPAQYAQPPQYQPQYQPSTQPAQRAVGRCSDSLADGLARQSSPVRALGSATTSSTASSTGFELQHYSVSRARARIKAARYTLKRSHSWDIAFGQAGSISITSVDVVTPMKGDDDGTTHRQAPSIFGGYGVMRGNGSCRGRTRRGCR